MTNKYSGGHLAWNYMKPGEILADTAAIGIMAFFGSHAVDIIDSVAISSGIYASINDIVRDRSDGDGLYSYTTRSIRRSAIPGMTAIGLRAANTSAQTPNEYAIEVGATTALYFGGLLLSPVIRKGPVFFKKARKSLINKFRFEDPGETTFKIDDEK